jgi:hypothetical protein
MCVRGECMCAGGWGKAPNSIGVNVCRDPICPIDCGLHGMCKENVCICQEGWQGPACREPKCTNNCGGRGTCTFLLANSPAECVCEYGFSPPDCTSVALYQKLLKCPKDCSGRGLCLNGACVCQGGSSGIDCSTQSCPPGQSGPNCEYLACPRDCMGYGMCFNGQCTCDNDHGGPDCSIPIKCYEACSEICLPDLAGARCEFCKGQCLTMLASPVVGHHNPMLARLYSLADLNHQNPRQSGRKRSARSVRPRRRIRRKHKEVSAVQTGHHAPRRHHREVSVVKLHHREVSTVRVGHYTP